MDLRKNIMTRGRKQISISNIINQKFGKLTIIEMIESHKHNSQILYLFKCDCGKEIKRKLSQVKNKNGIKDCGCEHRNNKAKTWIGHGEISGSLFSYIRRCAERKKLEWSISIEEIWNLFLKQDRKCALSGEELIFPKTNKELHSSRTASLDRIDSDKGYIINNLQWIHKDLNMMKKNYRDSNFINWCYKITDYNRLK